MYSRQAGIVAIAAANSTGTAAASLAAQANLQAAQPARLRLAYHLRTRRMPRIRVAQAFRHRLLEHQAVLPRPTARNFTDWDSLWNMEPADQATVTSTPAVLFRTIERTRQELVLEMTNNMPIGDGALSERFQLQNDSIRLLNSLSNTVALLSSIAELALSNIGALSNADYQNNLYHLHRIFACSSHMYTLIMQVVNMYRHPNDA